jgi:hypothetical protein
VNGLDEARRAGVISKGPAKLSDGLGDRVVRHGGIGPDMPVNCLLADEVARAFDEALEEIPRLRPDRDAQLAAPQPMAGDV